MHRRQTGRERCARDMVGMSLEVGLVVLLMAVALVIAIIATRGRF